MISRTPRFVRFSAFYDAAGRRRCVAVLLFRTDDDNDRLGFYFAPRQKHVDHRVHAFDGIRAIARFASAVASAACLRIRPSFPSYFG